MRLPLLFPLLLSACQSPEYLRLTGYWDGFEAGFQAGSGATGDVATSSGAAETGEPTGSTGGGVDSSGEVEGWTSGDEATSSESSGPAVEDLPGESPPSWVSLTVTPSPVEIRGPLTIEAVTEHAAAVELRLDGVSLGVFAPVDGKVEHELPIVSDGQDGHHVVDAIAASFVGEAPRSVEFDVDVPPGGQDMQVPWFDQEGGAVSAAFGMARHGDRLVTLGILDGGGWRVVLREHGATGELLGKRMLADWTERNDLLTATVSGFEMGLTFDEEGDLHVAANVVPAGQIKPRGYLVGLTAEGATAFPEVLLAPGEEIAGVVVRDGVIVAVGRKEVAGGRTVAAAWGFDAETGAPAWAPVLVDVPEALELNFPRSARFYGAAFTNDGNLIIAGSTQLENKLNKSQPFTRALFVRLNPDGLQLGEPEIFDDQYFFRQTAALAVSAFTGPDGICWTGWTRDGDFEPEMMVTDCRGETVVSRFTSAWQHSAGLAIAHTPLTGRVVVGGYRSLPGELNNGWVISFADGQSQLESPNGWTWEYSSAVGGIDRVTAVACQTYECDVLAVSDLLGSSQVRLGRVNQ